jgi:hypothetical protein
MSSGSRNESEALESLKKTGKLLVRVGVQNVSLSNFVIESIIGIANLGKTTLVLSVVFYARFE